MKLSKIKDIYQVRRQVFTKIYSTVEYSMYYNMEKEIISIIISQLWFNIMIELKSNVYNQLHIIKEQLYETI